VELVMFLVVMEHLVLVQVAAEVDQDPTILDQVVLVLS
tara:strand:- start:36 stop:149 length:114 start_codon:yes stop_codon:yes gene_type:complete